MTQPLDLDQIEARAAAATEGPWCTDSWEIYQGTEYQPGLSLWIGETCRGTGSPEQDRADAAFVAAARTDVPAMADEIRRLRAELATTERIRENADFHLGQEMARRQLAEKEAARLRTDVLDKTVVALQEKAQELSARADEEMRRDLEQQAQVWHEAADMVRRVARKEARRLAAKDAAAVSAAARP